MKRFLRTPIGYYLIHGILFLIILTVLAIAVLGFIPLKHQIFTEKATALLCATGADSCTIQSVEVTAFRSIRLQGIYLAAPIDSSFYSTVIIGDAHIPITIFEYFLKKKEIIRLFVPDPKNTKQHPPSRVVAQRLLLLNGTFSNGLNGSFSNVSFNLKKNGKNAFSGSEGTLKLSPRDISANEIQLQTDFPTVNTFDEEMRNVKTTLVLTSEGVLQVNDFSAAYCDGRIKAQGSLALYTDPFSTSYTITADNIDVSYWYTLHSKIGTLGGNATIVLRAEDTPLQSALLFDSLSAVIKNGTVTDLPLQQSLASSLFIPSLSSLTFNKLSLQLSREAGDTIRSFIKGNGSELDFTATGWIGINNTLRQSITGSLSPALLATLPKAIRRNLQTDPDRSWKFGCRLYGTFTNPRFELDHETLQRALGGIFSRYQNDIINQIMK